MLSGPTITGSPRRCTGLAGPNHLHALDLLIEVIEPLAFAGAVVQIGVFHFVLDTIRIARNDVGQTRKLCGLTPVSACERVARESGGRPRFRAYLHEMLIFVFLLAGAKLRGGFLAIRRDVG